MGVLLLLVLVSRWGRWLLVWLLLMLGRLLLALLRLLLLVVRRLVLVWRGVMLIRLLRLTIAGRATIGGAPATWRCH